MIVLLAATGSTGFGLTVMGVWAYTGLWQTWFTGPQARGTREYTGPAALFGGITLLLATAIVAIVLCGAPPAVSYALIVPTSAAAGLCLLTLNRCPRFLAPAWTRRSRGA